TVAKFFVFGLLGSDYDGSPYTQSGDLVAELAVRGIRLVIEEFRTDVTKTLKDGSRGKVRIDYGDPKEPEKPIAWLWKFIDGGKTAGELYGRALVVIAAEKYACRLVVPSSQQFGAKRWPSHRDHAAKALQKLAGPHLPATLKQLEKAVAKAGAELHDAQGAAAELALLVGQAPGPMAAPATRQGSRPRPGRNATRSTTSSSTSSSRARTSSMSAPESGRMATDTRTHLPRPRSAERDAGLTTGVSRSSMPRGHSRRDVQLWVAGSHESSASACGVSSGSMKARTSASSFTHDAGGSC
ncbi:MAG: hypothetical protein ACRDLR_08460, partial [Gaiellaceae bacterium]